MDAAMFFLSEKLNDPLLPAKIVFNEDDNRHLPLHWHNNVEICYFLKGGFQVRVDRQCYDVKDRDLVVINSGQMHYVGENSVGEHRGISLIANMDFWENLCPDLNAVEFDLSLFPEHVSDIKALMEQLYDSSAQYYHERTELQIGAACSREVLRLHGLVCLIYYTLMKYFSQPKTSQSQMRLVSQRTNLQSVVQYINTHYTEHLTLKDIAYQQNVSCEHLSRLFKKNLGLTFKKYLNSIRLSHACRMLIHSDANILEVAMAAGFPDLRSLCQQFDRVYQMTPKEYRKQYKRI